MANNSLDDFKQTKITMTLTVEDKRLLKMAAAERDTTMSALLHEWIQKEFKK